MSSTDQHPLIAVTIEPNPYVAEIRWQVGPVREDGVNGAQIDEVLAACVEKLRALNQPPYDTRETSLAITHIEEAIHWLEARTRDRIRRGVEGTSIP